MNIVIADIHEIFAEGLAVLLKKHAPQSEQIFVATNSTDTTGLFKEHDICLAFIDVELGNDDGRDIAGELSKKYPACKFIAITNRAEPAIIKSSLKGPFDAYILKTDSLEDMIDGIKTVLNDETFISPGSSNTLLNSAKGHKPQTLMPTLTKREKEILDHIAAEMSTKEIAAHLHISEKTVEVHRSHIMIKLNARNTAGIIVRAFELGILG